MTRHHAPSADASATRAWKVLLAMVAFWALFSSGPLHAQTCRTNWSLVTCGTNQFCCYTYDSSMCTNGASGTTPLCNASNYPDWTCGGVKACVSVSIPPVSAPAGYPVGTCLDTCAIIGATPTPTATPTATPTPTQTPTPTPPANQAYLCSRDAFTPPPPPGVNIITEDFMICGTQGPYACEDKINAIIARVSELNSQGYTATSVGGTVSCGVWNGNPCLGSEPSRWVLHEGRVCYYSWCGDGKLSPNEQCDGASLPPSAPAGSTCSASCSLITPPASIPTATPTPAQQCGNGTVDAGEQCDPNNSASCTGCACDPVTCQKNCNVTCRSVFTSTCSQPSASLTISWGPGQTINIGGTLYDCSSHSSCCPPSGANTSTQNDYQCIDAQGNFVDSQRQNDFPIGSACPHSGVSASSSTSIFVKDANGQTIIPPTYRVSCSCRAASPAIVNSICVDAKTSTPGAETAL